MDSSVLVCNSPSTDLQDVSVSLVLVDDQANCGETVSLLDSPSHVLDGVMVEQLELDLIWEIIFMV